MPVRTIDTRLGRSVAQRDQLRPRVAITSLDDERNGSSTKLPFDDWPFDFDPAVHEPAESETGDPRIHGSGARQRR